MKYVRKLTFEETPDYDWLRNLFAQVLESSGEIDDGVYDWHKLNGKSNYHTAMRATSDFIL